MKWFIAASGRVISFVGAPVKNAILHNSKRVRVVVLCKNKILLVKSSVGNQKWSLPGGGIEKNEDPMAAAVRELQEETSVGIEQNALACIGMEQLPRGKKWPQVHMTFYKTELVKHQDPAVMRPFEILEVKWFPLNQLPERHSSTLDIAFEMMKDN